MNTRDTRQHVHALVDQLPPAQLAALEKLLSVMVDPAAQAVAHAPVDDEPFTEEDAEAIRRSREWFKHNEGTSFEDVVKELGFTMDDIRNYREPA